MLFCALKLVGLPVFQPSEWDHTAGPFSLPLLQHENLFDTHILNSFRTPYRDCWFLCNLPLEMLHNLNHQVILANSSPISF